MSRFSGPGGNLSAKGPLKGLLVPFKGKGEVRAALVHAEAAEGLMLEAMIALKRHFDRSLPPPHPARLVLHRTARTTTLRWRLRSARRAGCDFVELDVDAVRGREILESLPKERRKRILAYQSKALVLNAGYAVYRQQRDILRRHLAKLKALERSRAHFR